MKKPKAAQALLWLGRLARAFAVPAGDRRQCSGKMPKPRYRAVITLAMLVVLASTHWSRGADSDDRLAWFKQAKFGMFIHWGIYSVPAGEWEGKTNYAEWFQLQTKMPSSEYEKFAQQFNPVKFDAKAWAKTAHDAGMKYVVITAKHHDGFSMFDSKLTE